MDLLQILISVIVGFILGRIQFIIKSDKAQRLRERFLQAKIDALEDNEPYQFRINGQSYTHPNQYITGSEIKTYANADPAYSICLTTPKGNETYHEDNIQFDLSDEKQKLFRTVKRKIS